MPQVLQRTKKGCDFRAHSLHALGLQVVFCLVLRGESCVLDHVEASLPTGRPRGGPGRNRQLTMMHPRVLRLAPADVRARYDRRVGRIGLVRGSVPWPWFSGEAPSERSRPWSRWRWWDSLCPRPDAQLAQPDEGGLARPGTFSAQACSAAVVCWRASAKAMEERLRTLARPLPTTFAASSAGVRLPPQGQKACGGPTGEAPQRPQTRLTVSKSQRL